MKQIKRGDIYYINGMCTATGSEQRSNRYAIVVSNDKCNKYSPVLIVVYITSKCKKQLPTHVNVNALVESIALCEQVHSVARDRFNRYVGQITDSEQERVNSALAISLGLAEVV